MNKQQPAWWIEPLALAARLAAWIGLPVIAGLWLGNWLDQKYGTKPWLSLAGAALAFVASMFGLIKESRAAFKSKK